MIIVCQKCSTRLQVDDEKSPKRPFNVRCPKCNSTVSSGPASPVTEQSALAVGGSPATDHRRFEQSTAHAYEPVTPSEPVSNEDTVRMIVDLLSKGTAQKNDNPMARLSWDKRKALVCANEALRDVIARKLTIAVFKFLSPRIRVRQLRLCVATRWTSFYSNSSLIQPNRARFS